MGFALKIVPGDGEGNEGAAGHGSQLCPVSIEPGPHLLGAQPAIATGRIGLDA